MIVDLWRIIFTVLRKTKLYWNLFNICLYPFACLPFVCLSHPVYLEPTELIDTKFGEKVCLWILLCRLTPLYQVFSVKLKGSSIHATEGCINIFRRIHIFMWGVILKGWISTFLSWSYFWYRMKLMQARASKIKPGLVIRTSSTNFENRTMWNLCDPLNAHICFEVFLLVVTIPHCLSIST